MSSESLSLCLYAYIFSYTTTTTKHCRFSCWFSWYFLCCFIYFSSKSLSNTCTLETETKMFLGKGDLAVFSGHSSVPWEAPAAVLSNTVIFHTSSSALLIFSSLKQFVNPAVTNRHLERSNVLWRAQISPRNIPRSVSVSWCNMPEAALQTGVSSPFTYKSCGNRQTLIQPFLNPQSLAYCSLMYRFNEIWTVKSVKKKKSKCHVT